MIRHIYRFLQIGGGYPPRKYKQVRIPSDLVQKFDQYNVYTKKAKLIYLNSVKSKVKSTINVKQFTIESIFKYKCMKISQKNYKLLWNKWIPGIASIRGIFVRHLFIRSDILLTIYQDLTNQKKEKEIIFFYVDMNFKKF